MEIQHVQHFDVGIQCFLNFEGAELGLFWNAKSTFCCEVCVWTLLDLPVRNTDVADLMGPLLSEPIFGQIHIFGL